MNCSHCNQVLAASAKFCNRCGTPQAPAETVAPAASRVCEACQTPCQHLTKFCPQCGHTLGQAMPTVSGLAATSESSVEPALPAEPHRPVDATSPAQSPAPPAQPFTAKTSLPSASAPSRPAMLRWILTAVAVVLVGGGLAWALLQPSKPSTPASGAQPSAAQIPQIDLEDRAKADALVGPPSSAQIPSPAAEASTVVDAPADDPPVPAASSETAAAAPRSAEPRKPVPSKPVVPPSRPAAKPEPQASPTLKDLLD